MVDLRKSGAGDNDEPEMGTLGGHILCGGDIYSCDEAIRRLNDYLDHELNEQERMVVIKHLELCRPCLSRFTFEQTLVVSLREKVAHLHLPDSLKEKLHILLQNSASDK